MAAWAIMVFIFAWTGGYGSVEKLASLELLPNEVRTSWAGMIFALSSIEELVINWFFDTWIIHSAASALFFFGAVNLCAALFALFVLVDVTGKTLEEASAMDEIKDDQAENTVTDRTNPTMPEREYSSFADGPMDRVPSH